MKVFIVLKRDFFKTGHKNQLQMLIHLVPLQLEFLLITSQANKEKSHIQDRTFPYLNHIHISRLENNEVRQINFCKNQFLQQAKESNQHFFFLQRQHPNGREIWKCSQYHSHQDIQPESHGNVPLITQPWKWLPKKKKRKQIKPSDNNDYAYFGNQKYSTCLALKN